MARGMTPADDNFAASLPESHDTASMRCDIFTHAVPGDAGAPVPFAWQHDRRLILLDEEQRSWVMAELEFDPEVCRYVEVRRASYRWSREAIGAVVSRALASGPAAAVDSALAIDDWFARYYPNADFAIETMSAPLQAQIDGSI